MGRQQPLADIQFVYAGTLSVAAVPSGQVSNVLVEHRLLHISHLCRSAGGCATDMTVPKHAEECDRGRTFATVGICSVSVRSVSLISPFPLRIARARTHAQRVCMIGPSETHTLARGALKTHLAAWQNLHRLIVSMYRGMFRDAGELVPVGG